MIWFLRCFFLAILGIMLGITTWASLQQPLWKIPAEVIQHPWFIATLFDTYFAFLVFYLWVAYREKSTFAKIAWLLGILTLGNIIMATYMLVILFRLPPQAKMTDILLRRS
jgi:Protein of unknown function (DUF1475)